jgi:O-antigen ligase
VDTTWTSKTIFFLLCLQLIWTTLLYGTVHQPTLALFYLNVVLIGLLWAYDSYRFGGIRFNNSLLQVPLLGMAVYALVQVIPFGSLNEVIGISGIPRTISAEPFATKENAVHYLALFAVFAAVLAYVDGPKRLRKLVLLISIFGFLYSFFAILQSVLSPSKIYGISRFASPFGSFVNRHDFAAYIEMTIALPLGLLFVGGVPKDKRLLYFTAVGIMGVALIMSGSRGGLVAMLAELFFLILITTGTRGYAQVALKVGLAAALVIIIIAGSMFIGGESSLTRIAETSSSKDFSTNRTHIWGVTIEVIKHNFPLGAGIGAFATAYTPYDSSGGLERVEQAHNDYLQILADAGIIGAILGGLFLFWLFKEGIRNIRSRDAYRRGVVTGALAGCFAVLVHSLFDFVLHITAISILFVTMTALVVIAGRKFVGDAERDDQPKRKSGSTGEVRSIGERRKK